MPTYSPANAETHRLIAEVIDEWHQDLIDAMAKIGAIMAHPTLDKDGEPTGRLMGSVSILTHPPATFDPREPEAVPSAAPVVRSTADPEVAAMGAVAGAMKGLDFHQAARVLGWATTRFVEQRDERDEPAKEVL